MEAVARVFFKNAEQRRQELGLSQTALARQAGITPSYYNDMKAGRCEGKETTRRKIADVLGVSYEELVLDPSLPRSEYLESLLPRRITHKLRALMDGKLPRSDLDSMAVYQVGRVLSLVALERRSPRDGARFLIHFEHDEEGEEFKEIVCKMLPDGAIFLVDGTDLVPVSDWDEVAIIGEVVAHVEVLI